VFSLTECEELVKKHLKIGKVKAKDKVEALLRDILKFTPSREWLVEARNYYDNNPTTTESSK
jgi:hypothetical protein